MNCELFQTIAAELARDENRVLMDAGIRAEAQTHAADCHRCAQTLLDQINLSEGLRGLSEHTQGWHAPAALEAQLLASFRDQKRARAVTIGPRLWRYRAIAAAMVLLGVGLLGLWAWHAQVTPAPQPIAGKDAEAVPPSGSDSPVTEQAGVAPVVAPQIKASGPGNSRPRRYPTPPNRSVARHVESGPAAPAPEAAAPVVETKEIATDFVPVGYGSALDLQDGGQLVRVELPRLALARFGLPMNMDRADERVKADVLVGIDGLARAIRFVK